MDCEQFDLIVIDLLYGELSEADAADARRHKEGCDRCAAAFSSLRNARRSVVLPLQEAPEGIEQRALEAARRAQGEVPWPRRIGRAISWAGSYAMRPQLAMAALLMLMLGSSLLLLRGRPGSGGVVRVTEQGVPEREHAEYPTPQPGRVQGGPADLGAARTRGAEARRESASADGRERVEGSARPTESAPQATPMPVAEAARSSEYDEAMAMYESKEFGKAQRSFDSVVAQGGPEASQAALYAAKSARAAAGCGAALPKFDSVITRYPNTTAAVQARWEAVACNRLVGNYDRARQLLADLRNIEGQRDRADHELARLGPAPRSTRGAAPARKPPPAKAATAY